MSARSPGAHRAVAWVKEDTLGVEFAEIDVGDEQMSACGVAIGTVPCPYRLDYELETGKGFVTARLRATSGDEGWRRELDLSRNDHGASSIGVDVEGEVDLPPAGGDTSRLLGALDRDLELSPVTNMMPILRHGILHGGGPLEFTMAWIAVPALAVWPDGQRYRHIRSDTEHHVVRFEAIDGSFAADPTLDADGVVIEYPEIARRLPGIVLERESSAEWTRADRHSADTSGRDGCCHKPCRVACLCVLVVREMGSCTHGMRGCSAAKLAMTTATPEER